MSRRFTIQENGLGDAALVSPRLERGEKVEAAEVATPGDPYAPGTHVIVELHGPGPADLRMCHRATVCGVVVQRSSRSGAETWIDIKDDPAFPQVMEHIDPDGYKDGIWSRDCETNVMVECDDHLRPASQEVTIELDDATEPPSLLSVQTPPGVWVRLNTNTGPSGFPEVAVRGPAHEVRRFVALHWGEDYVQDADAEGWWQS